MLAVPVIHAGRAAASDSVAGHMDLAREKVGGIEIELRQLNAALESLDRLAWVFQERNAQRKRDDRRRRLEKELLPIVPGWTERYKEARDRLTQAFEGLLLAGIEYHEMVRAIVQPLKDCNRFSREFGLPPPEFGSLDWAGLRVSDARHAPSLRQLAQCVGEAGESPHSVGRTGFAQLIRLAELSELSIDELNKRNK